MTKNIDKRIIDKGFHTGHEVEYVAIQKSDYEYLKEQAERVEELEEDIKKWEIVNESWEEINTQIVEQNKRYREVIEEAIEYANSPKILTSPAGIEKILSKALEGVKINIQTFKTHCLGCGKEVKSTIVDLTEDNEIIVDFIQDMEFECDCGTTTSVNVDFYENNY